MPKKVEIVEMPETLAFSKRTENLHKVPSRAWRKWNNQARFIFNTVYGQMADQRVMGHPKAFPMVDDHWKTIRWNSAWLAADAAMETVKK